MLLLLLLLPMLLRARATTRFFSSLPCLPLLRSILQ
jgi:hypothetical protein